MKKPPKKPRPKIYRGLAVVTEEDVQAGPLTMWDLICALIIPKWLIK